MQPGRSVETGLGDAAGIALEEPATRHTDLGRHPTGDDLGLIEASLLAATAARRCPGHDIDVVWSNTLGEQAIDQQAGEVVGQLSAVAILEPEQHVTSPPGERHGRDHIAARRQTSGSRERETTRPTQDGTRTVTTGTTSLKHHAISMTKGCHTVAWPAATAAVMGPRSRSPHR